MKDFEAVELAFNSIVAFLNLFRFLRNETIFRGFRWERWVGDALA